MGEKEKE